MDLSALTIQQLRYLVAVEHHRSFREAASSCSVTQPALSAQVKKVEDLLGFCVFDRSRHPIVTTGRGERVVGQARIVLQEVDRIAALASPDEELAGVYRLGVLPSLASTLVPLFLPPFTRAHPRVELELHETKTDVMIRMLREGALDGGFAATPLDVPGIEEQVVFHEAFRVYLPPGHPLLEREAVHQSELIGEHVWLLSEGHCFRTQVLHLCSVDRRAAEEGCKVRFDGGSFETLIRLVDAGCGVTVLPELVVQGLPAEAQRAQVRPMVPPEPMRQISLLHGREHVRRAAAEALFRLVREHLPEEMRTPPRRRGVVLSPLPSSPDDERG